MKLPALHASRTSSVALFVATVVRISMDYMRPGCG